MSSEVGVEILSTCCSALTLSFCWCDWGSNRSQPIESKPDQNDSSADSNLNIVCTFVTDKVLSHTELQPWEYTSGARIALPAKLQWVALNSVSLFMAGTISEQNVPSVDKNSISTQGCRDLCDFCIIWDTIQIRYGTILLQANLFSNFYILFRAL